ncbi:MAG: hypothetical protein ACRELB_16445 [Polyangiaceae bacterium]
MSSAYLREHAGPRPGDAVRAAGTVHATPAFVRKETATVKVHELIAILQRLDGEAAVLVMCQPHYPFECEVAGVAVRDDFPDDEEDPTEGVPELPGNDVFIVEGSQLRYGEKGAWRAARRR